MEVGETQAAIDLDIVVEYGVSIADLGRSIQRNVKQAVERMTGLDVVEVNVNVDDLYLPGSDDQDERAFARVMTGLAPPGETVAPAVVDGVDLDAVAAAARSCAAVDDLCPGPWGGVVTYLPGRQVPGVRVASDHVVISVRGRWGVPASELAGQVRAAVTGLVGGRRVDLVVADLADATGQVPARRAARRGELVDDEQSRRRARREFIRAHHPDRGGDPAAFAAGLAELDQLPADAPAARVVVVADTPWLVSLLTALMHRIGWRRRPPRVR